MSTYTRSTKHPITGEWDDNARWIDDYYGRHNYGVRFESGEMFDPRDFEMETRTVPMASVSLEDAGAHKAEVTEHPDGRRDVTIKVTKLDVDESTPEGKEAKRVIEEEVIPKIQEAKVCVLVIHKPTNKHTSKIVKLPQVREFVKFAIGNFVDEFGECDVVNDFLVVEAHDNNSYQLRVSSIGSYE